MSRKKDTLRGFIPLFSLGYNEKTNVNILTGGSVLGIYKFSIIGDSQLRAHLSIGAGLYKDEISILETGLKIIVPSA